MQLELVTLSGPKLQAEVYEVILPTEDGRIAIYPHHMPLVTNVVSGVIAVRHRKADTPADAEIFATNGGVAEITGTRIRLLVDEADHASDIVAAEAQAALEAAQALKQEAKNEVELERAEALIDRQAVRLKVAEIRRHRGRRTTE